MKESIIFGYPDFEDWNLLLFYREFSDGMKFLVNKIKILDIGYYPVDTEIFIVDHIGINIDNPLNKDNIFAGDSTTIEMKTVLWP